MPVSDSDEQTMALRHKIRGWLQEEPPSGNGLALLALSLILFLTTSLDASARSVVLLLLVVTLHEVGHLVGMKLFGFRDLRMFFIPFFGAAASGHKRGATALEHALVSLLGPLPGILIGTTLLAVARDPLTLEAGTLFLMINAFNLLPISPLDGGRFFEVVAFGHRPWLETAFRVTTAAALCGLAIGLGSAILAIAGMFGLIGAAMSHPVAVAAADLRRRYPDWPAEPSTLDDHQVDALGAALAPAKTVDPEDEDLFGDGAQAHAQAKTDESAQAMRIRQMHDRLARQHATGWVTAGLLVLWLAGWAVTAGGLALLAASPR